MFTEISYPVSVGFEWQTPAMGGMVITHSVVWIRGSRKARVYFGYADRPTITVDVVPCDSAAEARKIAQAEYDLSTSVPAVAA